MNELYACAGPIQHRKQILR